jgi:transcriptional regulator with XRE-family HTH domain
MKKSPKTKSVRLAKKLLHIRSELKLSQAEMLVRLGFSEKLYRSNVSQYELGTRVPALPVLLAYARVAGVNMEDLADDDLDLPERLSDANASDGVKQGGER